MSAFRSLLFMLVALLSTAQMGWAEGRKFAVVIGVNTYRPNSGLPSLQHAARDATQLAAVLRQQGFKVFEMTHEVARQPGQETLAPNADYIRDQISGVLDFPNLGEDDAVLITLHGHGVQFDLEDKATGNKTPKFYFCPADATITEIQTANELTERNHLLPLEELYAQLGDCTATTKLLIVDACRNDPTRPPVFRAGLASATLPKLPPPTGGTAAFFSCKANQQALEDPELQQGVFTYFLVQGLNGAADQPLANKPADGIITFAELSTYVANNTYDHVYDAYKVKQSPELRGDYDLNLPLARVLTPALAVRKAGETRDITLPGGVKLVQVWIPKPQKPFTMGTPGATVYESPVQVTLTQGFWLGQTEITQGQWQAVMGTTPWVEHGDTDHYKVGATYPATYVSWYDAVEFCNKLSASQQLTPCYKITNRRPATGSIDSATVEFLASGTGYRLPTEAQWEYACRAGTSTAYSFGDDASKLGEYAWFHENAWGIGEKYAHIVGQKKPNPWGLFDMHGNVWEWCQDGYEAQLPGGSDPLADGDIASTSRVLRGGSWYDFARNTRSAVRVRSAPVNRNLSLGFRVCVSVRTP